MSAPAPGFSSTPVQAIGPTVDRLRRTFHAHKTKPLEYRFIQLRKLYWAIHDHEDALIEAGKLDLGKPAFETFVAEVLSLKNDIIYICQNLKKWAADEKAQDVPLINMASKPMIRKDPLGTVLVIGAYNYPFVLSLGPLIGAMAAGCTAVLKPSEIAPHSAVALQKVVEQALDPAAYAVVQGAIPETTALLDQKWDKICYTGSGTVGKIVAKKAAETLTPVILELGGRNPAIITKNADPHLAARRVMWGKVMNAGQVCLSENYLLVDREILPLFAVELKAALDSFFPQGARNSPDYGRIVNRRHFHRIKSMLDKSNGKILFGGSMDETDNFIEPTVIQVDDLNDSLLKEEIFGPLLPIYPVDNLDEAIRITNEVSDTPLAIYPFGKKEETDRVLRETRSGGVSVNDTIFHASVPSLPFGGVGESGQGAYHGRSSFECFSHRRSVTSTPSWVERFLTIRYPPYDGKMKQFRRMTARKPNFDREGQVQIGLLDRVLTLGGDDGTGTAVRYLLTALALVLAAQAWSDGRWKLW